MVKKYCAAPWRGLHINFRGDVKTCCAGDPNVLGNLNDHKLEDILQSAKMIEIRDSLKNGQLHPEYCSNCVKSERYGKSERDWHNDVNQDFDVSAADLNDHKPSIVDVRWNITCNLACNYCGPYCSSRWAALVKFEYRSGARPYYQQVCDYMQSNAEHVREVALVGGEPLLLPENDRLLDVIPANSVITLITNLSVDFATNSIVHKLSHRAKVGWSMSFDNIGYRFEFVRFHGNWKRLTQNVNHVLGWIKNNGHWGGIHAVYNLYNCTRLRELRTWADQTGIKIHWQTLHQPEYLDPVLHSPAVKSLALKEINLFFENFDLDDTEQMFFSAVQKRLTTQTNQETQSRFFWQHLNDMAAKYHRPDALLQFAELWPELQDII